MLPPRRRAIDDPFSGRESLSVLTVATRPINLVNERPPPTGGRLAMQVRGGAAQVAADRSPTCVLRATVPGAVPTQGVGHPGMLAVEPQDPALIETFWLPDNAKAALPDTPFMSALMVAV